MNSTAIDLNPYIAPYAYWRHARDPESGLPVPGIGTHLYAFFCEPGRNPAGVELTCIEFFAKPAVPGAEERRADLVTIEVYNSPEPKGEVVFEGALNWQGDVARVALPGVTALGASVRCHWKHPVVSSSYQLHPQPWNIPYGIFEDTKWHGRRLQAERSPFREPPVQPRLALGKIEPKSVHNNLRIWQDGRFAHFESDVLKVAFSLIRPRIAYLAWDALGSGRLSRNFLVDKHAAYGSGPFLRDMGMLSPPLHWGGEVELDGNVLRYNNLHCHDGIGLNATWTVEPDAINLEITQRCDTKRTFLDAASWRFVWEGRRAYSVATLAEPQWGESRNGMVGGSGGWHAVSQGTLSFETRGDVQHHVENLGYFGHKGLSDFQVGAKSEPYGPVSFLPGTHSASLRLAVTNIEPQWAPGVEPEKVHRGLRRAWGTILGFRPEHGGFSNNAHSANCHHVQYWPADVVAYTGKHTTVPDMVRLMRHTTALALKGGPGCGSMYDSTHDAAPSLVIAAGRCHQIEPDASWLADVWPWLRRPISFILENIDESGMYTSRLRSGNSVPYGQPHPPSSNAWDCVGFGHHDGYAGMLAYRALRNAVALARDAGELELSRQCESAAIRMRQVFAPNLFNPETGWLAGWRSKDGQLHDAGCYYVTTAAICLDMIEKDQARAMMERFEAARIERGITDFYYGLPPQWDPIPLADTRIEVYDQPFSCGGSFVPSRADGADTYGIFTNGGWTPGFVHFYVQALMKCGFHEVAGEICRQMLQSFDDAIFDGPPGDGCEAFTQDGMKSGYEGTLVTLFGTVVALAQQQGWIKPLNPEWWPA